MFKPIKAELRRLIGQAVTEALAAVLPIVQRQNEHILSEVQATITRELQQLCASQQEQATDIASIGGTITTLQRSVADLAELISSSNLRNTELAQQLAEFKTTTDARYSHLTGEIARTARLEDRITVISNSIAEVELAIGNRSFELENKIAESQLVTTNKAFELGNQIEMLHTVIQSHGRDSGSSLNELLGRIESDVGGVLKVVAELALQFQNKVFELQGAITHATTRIDVIGFELTNKLVELENVSKHLNGLVENGEIRLANLIGERVRDASSESISRILAIEAATHRKVTRELLSSPRVIKDLSFEVSLQRARTDFPRQFDDWFERLETLEAAIAETSVGNLANWSDPYSRAFKGFVDLHAAGNILDVGCGTLGRPVYLSDFPVERLSGLEPLTLQAPFDFPVTRGIGEYLPWEDGSFDTVISATSIDHALSLDQSLREIARVLVKHGTVLMWVGSIPGTKPYDPWAPDYRPADRFHLFHIDQTWFEPMLERHFVIRDRVALWTPSHEHIFYKLGADTEISHDA